MPATDAKPVAAPTAFAKRYARMPRGEIAYLRFILESYDGLAFARTLDSENGLVEIAFPPEREDDVAALLEALSHETGLSEVVPPAEVPPL